MYTTIIRTTQCIIWNLVSN